MGPILLVGIAILLVVKEVKGISTNETSRKMDVSECTEGYAVIGECEECNCVAGKSVCRDTCPGREVHQHSMTTLIQRKKGEQPIFESNWQAYKRGFGVYGWESSAYWRGLESIHNITSSGRWQVLLEWQYGDEDAYVIYDDFKVDSESNRYKLHVGELVSMKNLHNPGLKFQDGMYFTTNDNINSPINCAGGWWQKNCCYLCLNQNEKAGCQDHFAGGSCRPGKFKESLMALRNVTPWW